MFRRCSRWTFCTGLGAVFVLLLCADRYAAQTEGPVGQQEKKGAKTRRKAVAILDERLDMKEFQNQLSLKEALGLIHDQLALRDDEFSIFVDADAFKQENPDAPDIFETRVQFPQAPKKMTVAMALGIILNKVPTNNATFVVLPDRIEITTYAQASVEQRLQQRVLASFENRKLSEVFRELSERTGTTIVIDNRAADKEDRAVSATFLNDVNLAGALRVLSEMAELKVVVLDGAIYVTTPAQAEILRKEKIRMDEAASPLWPILPPYPSARGAAAAVALPDPLAGAKGLQGFPGRR
jgi:hypothetical protein